MQSIAKHNYSSGSSQRTLYDVIGVTPRASVKDIEAACLELAARYNPEKNPGDVAVFERFAEVERAYAVLSDPAKRAGYDASLKEAANASRRNLLLPAICITVAALGFSGYWFWKEHEAEQARQLAALKRKEEENRKSIADAERARLQAVERTRIQEKQRREEFERQQREARAREDHEKRLQILSVEKVEIEKAQRELAALREVADDLRVLEPMWRNAIRTLDSVSTAGKHGASVWKSVPETIRGELSLVKARGCAAAVHAETSNIAIETLFAIAFWEQHGYMDRTEATTALTEHANKPKQRLYAVVRDCQARIERDLAELKSRRPNR